MLKAKKDRPSEVMKDDGGRELTFGERLAADILASENKVFGVNDVARIYGRSMRTVCEWKAVYADFPVLADPVSGVWRSCVERLDEWRERHCDRFLSREEMKDRNPSPKRLRRW